jgi:hypothetical protein
MVRDEQRRWGSRGSAFRATASVRPDWTLSARSVHSRRGLVLWVEVLLAVSAIWAGPRPSLGQENERAADPGSSQEGRLHVGVLGRDGVAIPIAVYYRGSWSKAWPEPVIDRAPADPPAEIPLLWFSYVEGAAGVPVHFRDRVITEAHCATNWAYTTDWTGQIPRDPHTVRQIAGMILSDSVPLIEEDSIPGVAAFRERFDLVTRDAYRRSTTMGYFRLDGRLIGAFLKLGYEVEQYQIYELDADGGRLLLDVSGGGC